MRVNCMIRQLMHHKKRSSIEAGQRIILMLISLTPSLFISRRQWQIPLKCQLRFLPLVAPSMISFINLILFFLLLWNDPGPPSPQPPVTSTAMKATNLRPVADPEKQLQVTLTSSLSPSNSSVTTTSLMSSLSSVTTPSYFSSSSSSSTISSSHHISSSSIEVPPALTSKSFLLYNRCSGGHIRVKGDRIIASTFASTRNKDLFYDYGKKFVNFSRKCYYFSREGSVVISHEDSNWFVLILWCPAVMLIQSHNLGSRQEPVIVVSIRGKRSGVFLCFNRRGKLVTRVSHSCWFPCPSYPARYSLFTFVSHSN